MAPNFNLKYKIFNTLIFDKAKFNGCEKENFPLLFFLNEWHSKITIQAGVADQNWIFLTVVELRAI